MGVQGDNQTPQTFTIGELAEHQNKELIPAAEMLHIFVPFILGDNTIELIPIKKRDRLSENVFILKHILSDSSDTKPCFSGPFARKTSVSIFQIFERTILDFNGTAMNAYVILNYTLSLQLIHWKYP